MVQPAPPLKSVSLYSMQSLLKEPIGVQQPDVTSQSFAFKELVLMPRLSPPDRIGSMNPRMGKMMRIPLTVVVLIAN